MDNKITDIAPEVIHGNDKLALKEADFYSHDKERQEGLKQFFHYLTIISLSIVFILAICLIIIRAFHFVAPTCWKWLNQEELQALDKTLFSGAIGGILSKYMSNIFNANKS